MRRGVISKLVICFALLFVITACQKQELSIIADLNEKIKTTKGDLQKAKAVLKKFLQENKVKMQKAVADFSQIKDQAERQSRYMKFNNSYYDGLYQTLNDNGYLRDKEFDLIFEIFKKQMGIFFEEERKLH